MQKRILLLLPILLLTIIGCRSNSPFTPTPLPPAPPTSAPQSIEPTPQAPTATPADDYQTFLPVTADRSSGTPPSTVVAPTTTPVATATPAYPSYEGPPLSRQEIGVQIHLHREDLDLIFGHLQALGAGWVKAQVSWKVYEPAPGEYDQFRLEELDRLVERANAAGIQVLLGVAKAPEWSRPTTDLDGPPSNAADYRNFMQFLAGRYRGRVAAYELWNESNLQREWNGVPLSPAALVALVEQGAAGVRAADPAALLVSAAPATTGINDGVIAIDDRVYLQGMLEAGIGQWVDAIGVHPYGWANPPTASAADARQTAPSHNNHPSFFFADTLRDYRTLLEQAGYGHLPLWLTEFGWGAAEGLGSPPAGAEFMNDVSEWQQAQYTLGAYALAHNLPGVGPLFLWNLNFAPTLGADFSESFYSLLRPDGTPRPVYGALKAVPKT